MFDAFADGCACGAPLPKENAVVIVVVAKKRASRPFGAARPAGGRRSASGAHRGHRHVARQYNTGLIQVRTGWSSYARVIGRMSSRGEVGDVLPFCRERPPDPLQVLAPRRLSRPSLAGAANSASCHRLRPGTSGRQSRRNKQERPENKSGDNKRTATCFWASA